MKPTTRETTLTRFVPDWSCSCCLCFHRNWVGSSVWMKRTRSRRHFRSPQCWVWRTRNLHRSVWKTRNLLHHCCFLGLRRRFRHPGHLWPSQRMASTEDTAAVALLVVVVVGELTLFLISFVGVGDRLVVFLFLYPCASLYCLFLRLCDI